MKAFKVGVNCIYVVSPETYTVLTVLLFSHSVVSNSLRPPRLSPPGSSVHGVFQARLLQWVAISYSRGSSSPRDQTRVSCVFCICRCILYHCATWEALTNLEASNKYRTELHKLKFNRNWSLAYITDYAVVWHWRSHLLPWFIQFSIYKEEVSYLPFRCAIRMILTFSGKLYLNLWGINI